MRTKHSTMQNQYCTFSYFGLKIKVRKEGNTMEYQTLNNGLKMPMVGFGVFRVPDKKECEESVYQAYGKPKSTRIERIKENIDIFDFELNEEEMKQISSLDMGYSGSRAKHFEPDFVRMVLNNKIHE